MTDAPPSNEPLPEAPLPQATPPEAALPETPSPETPEAPTLPQGPSFAFTFLYYFCGTSLVTTLLAVKTLGLGLGSGIPNQYGILVGAVGGLLGALVNRSATLEVSSSSGKTFKRELDAALAEMGYTEDTEADFGDILVYRRPFVRQIFSGRVYVLAGEKQAKISTRKIHLGGIKKRLEARGIRP